MSAIKKYRLFSQSNGGDGKAVCAFFSSPAGCRNGSECKFLHSSKNVVQHGRVAEVSETTSVISSEESGSDDGKGHMDVSPFAENIKVEQRDRDSVVDSGKKKRKKSGNDVFANPKRNSQSEEQGRRKMARPSEPPSKNANAGGSSQKQKKRQQEPPHPVNFRSLVSKLPIAAFSIPSSAAAKNSSSSSCAHETEETKESSKPNTNHANQENQRNKLPLPTSTDAGRKWLNAVMGTRKHERFNNSYDFQKYKEQDQASGLTAEWIKAKSFGSWCTSNPQAIAIDCEMCETQDPLTGAKNHKALCRLSVINAENPEEVLLDTLVKPSWPVTDYRTRINGISKEDLDSVEFTLRHAQAFMMALCSEETVIIGHAVHNDLVALHMEHLCIADSAFLYFSKDSTTASVSLKDLVSSIFQTQMPETHDSVNDSRKALDCVRHWVEKDGKVDQIERTVKTKANQLFIHRIPKHCKSSHLVNLFRKHTYIEPSEVEEIIFSGDTGKTHVTFQTTRHATLAFDTLEGNADEDTSGRMQKKVYLRTGDYIRVRKMSNWGRNSHGKGVSKKRESLESPK